jgi:hypothetical protein
VGGGSHGLIRDTMPSFAWSGSGNPIRIGNLHIEIQAQDLQNMKQECKKQGATHSTVSFRWPFISKNTN